MRVRVEGGVPSDIHAHSFSIPMILSGCTLGHVSRGTIIHGNDNIIKSGTDYQVKGHRNKVYGMRLLVEGNDNIVEGADSTIKGGRCTVRGRRQAVTGKNNTLHDED